MIRFFFVILFIILFLICSIPLLLIETFIGSFNPALKDRISQKTIQWAFGVCLNISGVHTHYIGTDNIPKEGAFLYVANHKSYFDIPLTYLRFPRPTGYVAKIEMEKYLLLSDWMRNIHCLFLDRENVKEGMKMILKGIEEIKSGVSICIFPEGTRCSDPDSFLPFHEGSFRMAEKAKCPIIPVSITNSRALWENHFPAIRGAHVIIEFGKPIVLENLSKEERKFLGAYVQKEIKKMYDKNKAILQSASKNLSNL
ncbi:MAG: 1-acyl-sn-glycerol-3-phosphate acyltransferase [Lachnospiraceae bacterium]|nr:1-acyl-sn-glycerol-3-phosphate acyltransferase [Lachnospiraceae bacterium]